MLQQKYLIGNSESFDKQLLSYYANLNKSKVSCNVYTTVEIVWFCVCYGFAFATSLNILQCVLHQLRQLKQSEKDTISNKCLNGAGGGG